jgi:transglutaminase-like putative cysteine protease
MIFTVAGCVTKAPDIDTFAMETGFFAEPWLEDFYNSEFFLESQLFNTFGLETVRLTTANAAIPNISMPVPGGVHFSRRNDVTIDWSGANEGFVTVAFHDPPPPNVPVAVVVITPSGQQYPYPMLISGEFDVFPLVGGSGQYTIHAGEIAPGGLRVFNSAQFHAEIADPFLPFLRPNRKINYTLDCKVVQVASELLEGETDFFTRIRILYEHVVERMEYDYDKMEEIRTRRMPDHYIPILDEEYELGKAVCYGYAAILTAMLRSQGHITRMVIGNASIHGGWVLHAWIDIYSPTEGWINNIVIFDGRGYSRLDPTWASSAGEAGERAFMDDGNYETQGLQFY